MREPRGRDARSAATALASVAVTTLVLLGGVTPAVAVVAPDPAPRPLAVVDEAAEVDEPGPPPALSPAPGTPVEAEPVPQTPVEPELPDAEVLARSTLTPGLLVATGCTGATVQLPLVGPVTWWVDAPGRSAAAGATSVPVDPRATTRVRAVLSQGATFTDGGDTAVWTVGPGAELDTRCEVTPPAPGTTAPTTETPSAPVETPGTTPAPAPGPVTGRPAGRGDEGRGDEGRGDEGLVHAAPAGTTGTTGTTPLAVTTVPAPTGVGVGTVVSAVSAVAATVGGGPVAAPPAAAPTTVHAMAGGGTDTTVLRSVAGRAAPVDTVVAASQVTPTDDPTARALAVALLLTGGVLVGRHLLRAVGRPAVGSRSRD